MSRHAERELATALARYVAPAGRVVASRSEPWFSATFSGARHAVSLALPAATAARFARALPEAELPLRDHFVADLAVVACTVTGDLAVVALEVLTIAEPPRGDEAEGNEDRQALVAAA